MKKRFTESQIVAAIKKQEAGIAVKEICRELGTSDATFTIGRQNTGDGSW
jgi:putative transposase